MELHLKNSQYCHWKTKPVWFLGLPIDETLSWKPHINKIANKLSRIVGLLKKVRNFLPSKALLQIYNSLFLPHLNYSILAWGYLCDRITKLQKQAIRTICFTTFNAHTEPLFKQLNILKLSDIMLTRSLKFYYRYSKNELPGYFKQMFSPILATHPYATRNRNVPLIPAPSYNLTKKRIRYYIPKVRTIYLK